ncbi:hypothetical protein H5410_028148, partial [Solanum commersonii]
GFCVIVNFTILRAIIVVAGNKCVLFKKRSLIPTEVKTFLQPHLIPLDKDSRPGITKKVASIEHCGVK